MTDAEPIALKASIPNVTNGTMNFFLILFSSSDSTDETVDTFLACLNPLKQAPTPEYNKWARN
jgi:hypothetical protein